MKYLKPFLLGTFLLACMSLATVGCGGGGGGGGGGAGAGQASTTILFDGGSDSVARVFSSVSRSGSSEVPVDEIESLTLTITEIVFLLDEETSGEDEEEDVEENRTVVVRATEFDPTSITIEPGEEVRWVWEVDGMHTITSGLLGDPFFGSIFNATGHNAGQVIEIAFPEAGVYPYFSNNASDIANAMTGTVIVEESDEDDDVEKGIGSTVVRTDDDDEDDDLRPIVVFSGSVDIDIVELTLQDLTELISEVILPAGEYKGIRLSIEDPRLVLKSDPDTVITDVHLTANGRLFIKYPFEIVEGEDMLVTVHFGGIHLIETGSGMYVLTPHLTVSADDDVDETDEPVETRFEGVISSVADDFTSMTVDIESRFTSVLVHLTPETIFTLTRTDDGFSVEDLEVDQEVKVYGVVNDDGSVTASKVRVELEEEEPKDIRFEGVITAVADDYSSITVGDESRTNSIVVHLTPETELCFYETDLEPILEDLQVGVEVKVFGLVNDDESVTATKIKIFGEEEPEEFDFDGRISFIAQDLSSITVNTITREASIVVQLTDDTSICLYGSEIPLDPSDLLLEMGVIVIGVENGQGGVTARKIKVIEEEEVSTD